MSKEEIINLIKDNLRIAIIESYFNKINIELYWDNELISTDYISIEKD